VILCSHYDTRPRAHQEPNPRDWDKPFLSANDGGSGVALLMELAHHMKDLKTAVGVDFVLFDGEEYVFDDPPDVYFFGSEHFARQYKKGPTNMKYVGAILMDMIGGKNARFPIEPNSLTMAGALTGELWKIADQQGCDAFIKDYGEAVRDDHLALNRAGIPAVDIIDFKYPHWHRLTDVPANCSGESLNQVARVLTVWLQRVK
jgi:Zn-dependent M28 family amino/carboxypeptidase